MAKAEKHHETGNAMDYAEHDRTYAGFLAFTKWSVVLLVALMLAMTFGFLGGGGLIGGTVLFVILSVISYFVV